MSTAAHRLTRWFSPDVRPTIKGVYQTDMGFQYWNGRWWGSYCHDIVGAFRTRRLKSVYQENCWRGLKYLEYRRQAGALKVSDER